jgi:hypothetical protein
MSANLYAPPKAQVADIVQHEEAPALWNPGAAASWSLLFSTAFGAFLHMRNWEALGEPAKAAAAKQWIVIYLLMIAGLIVASVLQPANKAMLGIVRLCSLAMLIAWYCLSGKPQIDFVKSRYGKDYPRKGWAKPMLVTLGVAVGLIFVLGVGAGIATVLLRRG